MRWTHTLIPTLKEVPADAEIMSHQLLVRAGLVRASARYVALGFDGVQCT